MNNQKSAYKAGDSIKIEACRTTIDGRKYWIAKSYACNDKSVVLLDNNNAPSWGNP